MLRVENSSILDILDKVNYTVYTFSNGGNSIRVICVERHQTPTTWRDTGVDWQFEFSDMNYDDLMLPNDFICQNDYFLPTDFIFPNTAPVLFDALT